MNQSSASFVLPRKAGLTIATALRDHARQADRSATFTVDASEVEELATPTLLVLLSIDKSFREQGGGLALRGPTDAVVSAFTDLGLYQRLMAMEFVT